MIWTAMAVWSAALFAIVRHQFVGFGLGRFDLGNMVQAVWSTTQGRPLEVTGFEGDEATRLVGHVDPVLILLASLWLVVPSPLTVLLVNVVVIALGALPVYWLGRRHLDSEKAAALLALAYLAYPWLGWAAVDAFHPVTLAIPLFLYCVWFLDTDRMWAFAGFAVLAMSTGELMGLTIAALGIWYALVLGRQWAGAAIAMCGTAWTAVSIYLVVPASSDGPSVFYGYYGSIGGSPEGVVKTALSHPWVIASTLFTSRDLLYLLWLALPLAFLFVLAGKLAAVAVPQLLASGLSDTAAMTDPRHHYAAAVIPFLIAGTVLGVARLSRSRQVFGGTIVLTLCVGLSVLLGPWPGAPGNTPAWDSIVVPDNHADVVRDAISFVPDHAPVSATNRAGSHLSARRYFYSPLVLGNAEWVVLDMLDPFIANPGFPVLERDSLALEAFRRRLDRSTDWTKVFDRGGVLVYRKTRLPHDD
jgi:uncharacterized membrane protein